MDNKAFKMINIGVCAYFLIPYSFIMFLLELWYSSFRLDLLISSGICLLMLLIGVFLFSKYRSALVYGSDDGSESSSAPVKLIGGFIILIIIVQLVVRQLSMSLMRLSFDAAQGILIFLLISSPFIIFSVINIRKGLKIKNGQRFSGSIDFVACRVVSLYLMFTGIYQLLLWSVNTFSLSDYFITPFDLFWNAMPLGSIALALFLYLAPMRINRVIRDTDHSGYKYLSFHACVTGGWLMLITALFEFFDRLLPHLAQLVIGMIAYSGDYSGFMGARPFVEFAPVVIVLIISIASIIYGKKRRNEDAEVNE